MPSRDAGKQPQRRAPAQGTENRCPCCGRPVGAATEPLEFNTLLRGNDVQKVFTITPDRRLVWAPDVAMQEGAQAFADAVNAALADTGGGGTGRGEGSGL